VAACAAAALPPPTARSRLLSAALLQVVLGTSAKIFHPKNESNTKQVCAAVCSRVQGKRRRSREERQRILRFIFMAKGKAFRWFFVANDGGCRSY
jgi:hypothetical protein